MKKNIFSKCTALVTVLCLFFSLVGPVYAQDNAIQVQLNGKNMSFDVAPRMVNNRILVPMRAIFEELGAKVDWQQNKGQIVATKDNKVVTLNINSVEATLHKADHDTKIQMDQKPLIISGRVMVPVRFIAESLGNQVGWDSNNKTVVIIDYGYFLNLLKNQAPNFYEYATKQYEPLNTGEMNAQGNMAIKYKSTTAPADNLDAALDYNFNAKINEENGSFDAKLTISGMDKILKEAKLDGFNNMTFTIRFDNNNFYIKSNLTQLLDKEKVLVGDRWIKVNVADLQIPNIKTIDDIKKLQQQVPSDQLITNAVESPMELDVNSFAQAQKVFDVLVNLVDNNHFVATKQGDTIVYTWKIQKQDLVDTLMNIQKLSGESMDLSLEDLAELKQIVDNMTFDFQMVTEVKNNICVNSKVNFNLKMDLPEGEHIEATLKSDSEILNPNNANFDITIPSTSEIIDINELKNEELTNEDTEATVIV